MKLDIEFHYTITYVPYRHQNDRTATGGASTTVEIREVGPEDAPIVMLVGNPRDTDDEHAKRYVFKENGDPREVRFFDGMHFVEAGPVSELKWDDPKDVAKSFFGRGTPRNTALDKEYSGTEVTTAEEVERKNSSRDRPLRELKDDLGAAKAREMAKLASMMIVVGDTVFEYTPEPVVKVLGWGDRTALVMPRPEPEGEYGRHRFHDLDYPSERRAALKHADTLRGYADGLPFAEAVDPSRSTFDGAGFDVFKLCEDLSRTFVSNVKALPWEGLEAYYRFRDALEDAAGRVTPRLVDAVAAIASLPEPDDASTVAAVAARMKAKEPDGWGNPVNAIYAERAAFIGKDGLGEVRKAAAEILDRWERRPSEAYWENGVGHVSSARGVGRTVSELLSEGSVADAAASAGVEAAPLLAAAAAGSRILASQGRRLQAAIATMDSDGSLRVVAAPADCRDPEALFEGLASAIRNNDEEEGLLLSNGDFTP